MEEKKTSIAGKLIAIQAELKAPKDKTNTFGGYKYRSCESILEAVKPLLKKYGVVLLLSDSLVEVGGRVYVKATAQVHDGDDGIEVHAFAREPESKKGMDDSQITGTASSYARKYALNGLFAIDDTKDADTNEYAKETQTSAKKGTVKKQAAAEPEKTENSVLCSDCGKEITDHLPNATRQMIIDGSVAKYKKPVCFDCIRNRMIAEQEKKAAKLDGEYQALIHEDAGDRI